MSDSYNAFEMSPVPAPGPDAVPPEPFHGIYGMPAFVTIPTSDLAASVDFWIRGLGFFELFGIPGRLVHLRRWAFQDVLLVSAASVPAQAPAVSFSFACVLSQVDSLVEACREFLDLYRPSAGRKVKTYQAYRVALENFQESCPKRFLEEIDRRDLQHFTGFLITKKEHDPRTAHSWLTRLRQHGALPDLVLLRRLAA